MTSTGKLFVGAISASFITITSAGACAETEVSASVSIASSYLFRGFDLGSGTPQVAGDLSISNSGFYAGIWGASGDTEQGTEHDFYAGFGDSVGSFFSYDVSIWNYVYPTGPEITGSDAGEFSEIIVALSYGPLAVSYVDNIAGDTGFEYYSASASRKQFSVTLGFHDNEASQALDPIHIDVAYAYNDNLTFTLSQFVEDEAPDDDLKFVVSYAIPLG